MNGFSGSASENGKENICTNFREFAASSRAMAEDIEANLKLAGIEGELSMGEMEAPVCQLPLDISTIGMIIMSGLNSGVCRRNEIRR